MVPSLSYFLFLAVVDAAAISSLEPRTSVNTTYLPIGSANTTARAEAIEVKREGWGYGPSKLGNSSYYPNGTLGDARSESDQAAFVVLEDQVIDFADEDIVLVEQALTSITTIEDYNLLYDGQWLNSLPDGIDAGLLTNYTDDLLFSMLKLSANPYQIERLNPSNTTLPFDVDADTVLSVAGESLESLLASGSLFLADHSYQSALPSSDGLYSAYCSAYFYINSTSGDFLPLAIKTNIGSDLVYTPLDTADDWLLAKIMFNQNDAYHAQIVHVSYTHSVAEIVYESAIRTLSDDHPLLAILDRIMLQAFAIRPQGELLLFAEGGLIDTYFGLNHVAGYTMIEDFYSTAGAFVSQYLETDVTSRCLVNCAYGPALKSFPYYEDALVIQTALKAFFTVMICSYYTSDSMVSEDYELQNWLVEANGPAKVNDFPTEATTTQTVVDIMTHMAFLTGVQHHVLNTGATAQANVFLPFRPTALFAEPPATKNITDIMPYLTPLEYALPILDLLVNFNRPSYPSLNLTLEHMFDNSTLLERLNDETVAAAEIFKIAMQTQAEVVGSRSFDEDGLSQGAPFIYKQLNPGTLPFFLTV